MSWIKLYVLALILFCALDFVWLGVVAKNLYKEQIGFLMADQPRWSGVILFYLLYIAGLLLFVLLPSFKEESWKIACIYGAIFGLVCYGTYDLTNFATLKGWPGKIVVYDLLWGTFLSSITSLLTFIIGIRWK